MMTSPLIEARQLTIQADLRILLENCNFKIYPHEITLLVGASGSGKTILMKLLAGLILKNHPNLRISGEILLSGKDILRWRHHHLCNSIGIVFQDYGLFDTYSISQNLDFAFAHSQRRVPREERKSMTQIFTEKLDIDPDLAIRHASGGQKRRIAIARTLAYNPDIIIYDEPISGLDPQMSKNVAQLIRKTHKGFSKQSSIVVTHDYEEFLPLVDRILFLDPQARSIQEVSRDELHRLISDGRFQAPALPAPPKNRVAWFRQKGELFLTQTTDWTRRIITGSLQSLWRLLPIWKSPKWGLRFFFHYLRLLSFFASVLYVCTAGAIIGFVSSYFSFKFLPYKFITEPLITSEVLEALGYGLYRIMIPIMVSVLVAARSGAAVASDIGNRVYLQETESIKSMGASPSAYLQTGVVYASLWALPFLTFLAFLCARFFCLLVFISMHPDYNIIQADAIFHGLLREIDSVFFRGTDWILSKSLVCGFGIANICYLVGSKPKSSARDISHDITLTVILSTLFVMLTHLIFALLEF